MTQKKVRDCFKDPNFSEFNRTAVEVGELLERDGWRLTHENYSQGEQTFSFEKGMFSVDVIIEEEG